MLCSMSGCGKSYRNKGAGGRVNMGGWRQWAVFSVGLAKQDPLQIWGGNSKELKESITFFVYPMAASYKYFSF